MSSLEPTPDALPDGIRLRRLPPRSRRSRNAAPEWDVLLEGARIGWIQQWKTATATATFYRATAFHPDTGAAIALESNTDLTERVEKVVAAWKNSGHYTRRASWE